MKFHETHFDEYIASNQKVDLHTKLNKIINKFPPKIEDFKNVVFYGPSGIGKYTQVLKSIKKYSSSELKYEKKISVTYNKSPFYFKISDIHYEIDMSQLGCNSKLLWHEIFINIIDIISAKQEKHGIIVCKYFHEIHNELLDNFYSYMQKNHSSVVDLKFILITEELSFIPDNILNCCEVIHLSRPSVTTYNKCLQNKIPKNFELDKITNIKNLYSNMNDILICPHKIICDKIIENIINIDNLKFVKFRDILYDIFIYNLNINHCIWYIISTLIKNKKIDDSEISNLFVKTYSFFQFYNNNYRPIYHIENYLFYVASLIHKYPVELQKI
jgi:hypothetical protein